MVLRAVVAGLALAAAPLLPAPASAADHALISGSGSVWAANAVNRWSADVAPDGLRVTYDATGSAAGRTDFADRTADFAVSDLAYQGLDPVTGADDTAQGREFAYVPAVAGGLAFAYHVEVDGRMRRDVRLSGPTLAGIFSGRIVNWDDAAITADNDGHRVADLPIVPVVHAEGSATSYVLTQWFTDEFGDSWDAYSDAGATPYFPAAPGATVRVSGSSAVMDHVQSAGANGAIGYDEYSYAAGADAPVAAVENAAGYYTRPTAGAVGIALLGAVPDESRAADLTGVYTAADPRAYPVSSYSSAIVPTSADDPRMTTAKRQTLLDWLAHGLCRGQGDAAALGDAALPVNLAAAGLTALARLHDADPGVDDAALDLSACADPTFTTGTDGLPHDDLRATVAMPRACDRTGSGPCPTSPAGTPGDYTGDGRADRAVYRPSTHQWYVRGRAPVTYGLAGDVVAPADYDGDGRTDIAVWRPSTGQWWVRGDAPVRWGVRGDVPVPGDYDGDGRADRAVYRPSTQRWYVAGRAAVTYGRPGDVPVPGDYDGRGITQIAVYRPSTHQWFVRGDSTVDYGLDGDVPVPADYTVDGRTDRAIYRPRTHQWYVRGLAPVTYGRTGDVPVPADYAGSGPAQRAMWRPSTGEWFVHGQATVVYGRRGDVPVT